MVEGTKHFFLGLVLLSINLVLTNASAARPQLTFPSESFTFFTVSALKAVLLVLRYFCSVFKIV